MQIKVRGGLFFLFIFVSLAWYIIYVVTHKVELNDLETTYPKIGEINTSIREYYSLLPGKAKNISSETKNIYDKNVKTKVGDIKSGVESGINTAKSKVDNFRKNLSGAEDTVNEAKETIDQTAKTIEQMNKLKEHLKAKVLTGSNTN